MQTSAVAAVRSPPFGYLSPPIDGCDASSEDGDTLQTPLTEHDIHHQPYAVYHQHSHHFSHDLYHSDVPQPEHSLAKPEPEHHQGCAPFSALLTPSATEKFGRATANGCEYFSSFSPPHALDLANASLEFNSFSASFAAAYSSNHVSSANSERDAYAQDTPSYDIADSPFEYMDDRYEETGPGQTVLASADSCELSALPALSISAPSLDAFDIGEQGSSLLLAPASNRPDLQHAAASDDLLHAKGRIYSPRFPADHSLNPFFVTSYELGDELGAGGYGFVMTARHRTEEYEVAVKFIIKDKVPEHAWWDDEMLGRVPTEVMIMSLVDHENIVRCLDLFEDDLYFYLVSRQLLVGICASHGRIKVQELHGTPWVSRKKKPKQITAPGKLVAPSPTLSTPSLTPSPSTDTNVSLPPTPPQASVGLPDVSEIQPEPLKVVSHDSEMALVPEHTAEDGAESSEDGNQKVVEKNNGSSQGYLQPPPPRPNFSRRPSYDLFECIEQSKHKRLSENHARYVFAQVVEAVSYLNSQGITHCDIKDENLVIDAEYRVKLIDFGSAVIADPYAPAPYYTLFFGTTAYASSEILRKAPYRAAPAEVWTLGVLLSYLLTGHSPFPTEQDAVDGRVVVRERGGAGKISRAALNLMARCLERDPERRTDIAEIRGHRWLQGALERDGEREQ
ncbi:uncharacterized protein PHACADRAFT_258031 [Phanerochaete carnosa HHB-10118-sp]|uniref:Protein kinase domain-containing protein n=1 Tax=Phanerochaete carnosa (strain HHB-10118-sp) TaxID=650164 RepID=K5W5S6_PHACS|nr:uncharacterized protein PHACADRAFT_258031 [Phanerochaete carnosa HHB-10118-sp]EKM54284.1 hypothetical protein PHACADRAFT_258031 [Phanerochaete carnosa HHB-10118-sp]